MNFFLMILGLVKIGKGQQSSKESPVGGKAGTQTSKVVPSAAMSDV